MNATQTTAEIVDIRLAPGEFYFGAGYTRIHTLLGSCVAITMWHPGKRIGGMCHYLLPSRGINQRLSQGYYADEAVNMFLGEVHQADTKSSDYEVKVFGGGNMFKAYDNTSQPISVPQNNITAGTQLLKQHGFHIKATDVGGDFHRKIFLELWNGDVWLQRGGNLQRESASEKN
jgi:chemotaxis protein CheD